MNPVHRKNDLVIQVLGNERLVYDLTANRAICLNETTSIVWDHCDGTNDPGDIAVILEKHFGKQVGKEFVQLALLQLHSERLLEGEGPPAYFRGMTRREVIRKVGLSSMIALPIVSAITAPEAAQAQSTCIPGGTCVCIEDSGGRMGQQCATLTACTNAACRCVWSNNGNMNGDCVV